MRNLPIHWHEGQFLHPHHFQAADRYWTEITATSQQWDHPYNYGVHRFAASFAGTLFRVDEIQARMPDGTLICVDASDPSLTVELEHVLSNEAHVRVFLCVPKLRPRDSNVLVDTPDGGARFARVTRETYDENQSGDHDQEIAFRDLRARLLLATDSREGYEQLPIAQVMRGTGPDASPQLDEWYIPPVLATRAWSQLGDNVVRYIHDLLLQYIVNVTEKLRGINLRDHILEVSHSVHFALLDRLNETSCAIGALAPAKGVHPFTAYVELCRVVGKLSLFTKDSRAPVLPEYDHDNIGPVFREISALIRTILESIRIKDVLQKQLIWEGGIMQAELTAPWFDPRVDWLIGIRRVDTVSDVACRQLLSPANNYLMKLGSNDKDIYNAAAIGLDCQEVDQVPEGLPPRQNWSFWRIRTSGAIFDGVERTQTIAAYMRDGNHPFEPHRYAGTNRFPVVDSSGDLVCLELVLFGVTQVPS